MAAVLQPIDGNAMPSQNGSPSKKKSKGKRMSVERIYQKKTQREHILLRPDAYIGSVESETKSMWIWDDNSKSIVMKEITFCPGLYKIFDEVLVNAADNKQRDPSMNTIKINIDAEKNVISVWNNGRGIPIEMHKEQKVYVPTLIFGHLLTSSNYDDSQKKVTGGRNGFGAKLCNIYSKKFVVETACSEYNKKFKQVWKSNMTTADEPKIQDFHGTDFTCVTYQPDLPKFHMEKLSDDMLALLKRRAYDIAGCSRGVSVVLNGEKLRVKNFKDYVDLYLKSVKKDDDDDSPKPKLVHEICNSRWELCVTVSESGFQQSSFVNSIATTKGGSHVNYLVDQIASKMMTTVKKKAGKDLNVKAFQIKNHIWIFVNCLIENPTFDSQTKENMTLNVKSFGSTCELDEKFIKSVQSCGVLENVMNWVKFKSQEKLNSKCSGTKKSKIKGVPKLDDANDAGGAKSRECTLILTEGDSAKTLAISGIGLVGRDKFGVFPLRGKLLNVRDASTKQIMENAEVNNIVKILGLQYKKKYTKVDDLKSLRYGRIMIMTDQDQDGSHIKGLLINFFHSNWPDLLQLPFLEEFITPIVKVSKTGQSLSFFSLPELEEWKQQTANAKSWKVKYYKGLGTSTSKEAKEYFSDMKRHRIPFNYEGPSCDQAIKLAFSKKMVSDRKEWLTTGMLERKTRRLMGMPEIYLYGKETKTVSYTEFVNKELILFSNTDNERSIPSMIDGLKPGQRKVIYTCMKRNDKREVKVAQLAGSIAELSAYHHGEVSLMGTIINLAQNYVGSNNINLLQPIGQFGTRINGGKDSASPRYIFTMLSPLTRLIFPEQDDALLKPNYDDGMKIEPEWYCPIIPMVLVNGAEGIGTGWSTKIPNHNPRELVANIKKLIDGEPVEPMTPWYKNFNGTIEQVEAQKFVTSGQFEVIDEGTIEINELPIKTWTSTYKEGVLESFMHGTEKIKPCITDYRDCSSDKTVKFTVSMAENDLAKAEQEGIGKKFKLESSMTTSSMVLFDEAGALKKYENVDAILKDFYEIRLKKYYERKDYLKGKLEAEASKLENQARFILEKIEGQISIENRAKRDVISTLVERSYLSDPVKTWKNAQMGVKLEEDSETESVASVEGGPDFNYMLNMNLWSLSKEKKEELLALRDAKKDELFVLMKKSPEDLWNEDLDAFLVELEKVEEKEQEEDLLMAKTAAKGQAKNQRALKRAKPTKAVKKEKVVKKEVSSDEPSSKKDPSTKEAASKKDPPTKEAASKQAKAKSPVDDASSKSSEPLSLTERLAAKKSATGKVQSLLNFDVAKKKKPTKKLLTVIPSDDEESSFAISDFDDDDDDFIPKKKTKKQRITDEDDDEVNSETEKTKALIKKLTPVKQSKASSDSDSDVSTTRAPTAAKRNLLDIASDSSSELIVDDEKSSPPPVKETKKPAKKPTAATGKSRGKKIAKDVNQMTLFAATAKAADKKKQTSVADCGEKKEAAAKKKPNAAEKKKPTKTITTKAKAAKKPTKKRPAISSDDEEDVDDEPKPSAPVSKKAAKPANPLAKSKKAFNFVDEDDSCLFDDDSDDDDEDDAEVVPAKRSRTVRERKVTKYRFDETEDDIGDDLDDDDEDSDFSY